MGSPYDPSRHYAPPVYPPAPPPPHHPGAASPYGASAAPGAMAAPAAAGMRQRLTEVLEQRGPHALPYEEGLKWVIREQVALALDHYSSLQMHVSSFTHNDGRTSVLLQLAGTIPIWYRGGRYNIPITVWLLEPFPRAPPLVYVTPTPDMVIRANHSMVDPTGLVSVPYLHDWVFQRSTLLDLLQILSVMFGQETPLYSKAPPPPPQQQHYQQQQQQQGTAQVGGLDGGSVVAAALGGVGAVRSYERHSGDLGGEQRDGSRQGQGYSGGGAFSPSRPAPAPSSRTIPHATPVLPGAYSDGVLYQQHFSPPPPASDPSLSQRHKHSGELRQQQQQQQQYDVSQGRAGYDLRSLAADEAMAWRLTTEAQGGAAAAASAYGSEASGSGRRGGADGAGGPASLPSASGQGGFAGASGSTAAAVAAAAAAGGASVEPPRAVLKAEDPAEVFRRNAVAALGVRLQRDVAGSCSDASRRVESLLGLQQTLALRRDAVSAGVQEVRREKEGLEQALQAYLTKANALESWLAANGSMLSNASNADSIFQPADPLSKQLLSTLSADLALEDAIYALDRRVQHDTMSGANALGFDTYLQSVRSLARQQFFERALEVKIRASQRTSRIATMAAAPLPTVARAAAPGLRPVYPPHSPPGGAPPVGAVPVGGHLLPPSAQQQPWGPAPAYGTRPM